MEDVSPSMLHAGMAIEAHLIPDRLKQLREHAGLTMAAMARALGFKTASGYQRYEDRGRVDYLPYKYLAGFLSALVGRGVPPITRNEIMELFGNLNEAAENIGNITIAETELRPYGVRDLPILGQARAGDDSYVFESGAVAHAFSYRPIELLSLRDAYSVYVNGDSMSPRFRHGELVYVDPYRPPAPGDDVVIQLKNDQGYIKELVRRTGKVLRCRQHNPASEVDYQMEDVRSIHLIISSTKVRV